ncbi:MAG: hypothetical protein ACFC1C_03285 [Candidatus Malihini olakiniferum]
MQKQVYSLLIMYDETHLPSLETIKGVSDIFKDNSLLGGDSANSYLIKRDYHNFNCIAYPEDKTVVKARNNKKKQESQTQN